MVIASFLLVSLNALLISAHFYRADYLVLSIVSILLPLVLFCKQRWVPRVMSVFLLLAAAEWIRTMIEFIGQYQEAGISWTRLAVILGSVALCTVLSSLVFIIPKMKKRYL